MGNEKQKQVELIGKKKKFFKTLIRYKGDAVEAYMKTYRVQEGTAKKEVLKYMLDNNILQYLIEYATQMNKAGLKQKGKNVTAEEVINTARQVRDICLSTFNFNPSAVLQANEQLGKIGGLFIDITRNEPEDNRKSQIDKKLKELAQDADYSLDTESETDTETDTNNEEENDTEDRTKQRIKSKLIELEKDESEFRRVNSRNLDELDADELEKL